MIFIGIIANVGTDVVNNLNTAAPFAIPTGVQVLRIQPSAATQLASTKAGSDSTFAPAVTDMLQLGAANSVQDIPVYRGATSGPDMSGPVTLAIRKSDAGAGTCKVFALGRF